MDISSDLEFLAVAAKRLCHLFPQLPKQPAYLNRRRGLANWSLGRPPRSFAELAT
jgi:hypothetical protein